MRCLALDVGERRIGVAVGEVLARPLTTIKRRSKAEDFATIAELIRQHRADTLVVGLPLNMDGSSGFQAQRTARYAGRLHEALAEMGLNVQLVLWDERMSTEDANNLLDQAGYDSARRQTQIDAVAAAVILQSYLDSGQQLAVNQDS